MNQLKTLEETHEKEKKQSLERKYNLEILQVCVCMTFDASFKQIFYYNHLIKIKQKESGDQIRSYENIKAELELNITKLIEQLK